MPDNPTSPTEAFPEQKDDLRQTLDRIANALEKRNEQAEKKEGGEEGKKDEGGDEKKEGGDKDKEGGDKKEGDDKGKEGEEGKDKAKQPSKFKRFFTLISGHRHHADHTDAPRDRSAGLGPLREDSREHRRIAYTTGHVHQVSPRVSGLVTEVWVDDNQHVKQGDLLVKLDPRDNEVALERNQANLDQAKAQVLQAQAAVVQGGRGRATGRGAGGAGRAPR